ncbi:hypothetical protein, conserved [Eimeria maxima]|uniref:MHD domain-containing protein n=1 Tax=Eimeria maxima TaxID=5804 RepID=U6LZM4_EIMMA|nr:hypothetical protein, conserved [Eimeria maxima]CDJ56303.1 hypothetical protein, conserved [Eimeria maxima]
MPSTASRRPVSAAAVAAAAAANSSSSGSSSAAAAAAARRRSEIFVDVIEKISVVLAGDSRLLHASLEGSILMKSYLESPPLLKLALTDQIPISANGGSNSLFVSAEVTLRVRADLPEQCCAANLSVSFCVPKGTTSAALEVLPPIHTQSGEFIASEHRVQWLLKKLQVNTKP